MEDETYHIGLWNYARSFFQAANILRGSEEKLSSAPTYYLYGHSVELTLKSFLVYRGYSEKDLKKLATISKMFGKRLWMRDWIRNLQTLLK